jgi:CMP-N-acetylneuraminic acid synthetase
VAILGLVPARGGSKGIPRKNVLPIAGKPLIAWTIEATLAARVLDRVVVTTDDPEIAEIAVAHGADVPFLRPIELARDETPGIDPVLHALDALPEYDTVVLLQPTSPLRTSDDIAAAVALFDDGNAGNVISVSEASHVGWTFAMDAAGVLDVGTRDVAARRQDMSRQFVLNGAIYIAATARLHAARSFLVPGVVGYPMPAERSVDIDTMLDWRVAEMLLNTGA